MTDTKNCRDGFWYNMIFKRGHSKEGGKISVILRRRKEAKTVQEGERERSRESRGNGWLVCCQRGLHRHQSWEGRGWPQCRRGVDEDEKSKRVGNTPMVQRFCWALVAPSPPRGGPWSQLLWNLDPQVLLAWPETPALLLCVPLSVHGPFPGAEPRAQLSLPGSAFSPSFSCTFWHRILLGAKPCPRLLLLFSRERSEGSDPPQGAGQQKDSTWNLTPGVRGAGQRGSGDLCR